MNVSSSTRCGWMRLMATHFWKPAGAVHAREVHARHPADADLVDDAVAPEEIGPRRAPVGDRALRADGRIAPRGGHVRSVSAVLGHFSSSLSFRVSGSRRGRRRAIRHRSVEARSRRRLRPRRAPRRRSSKTRGTKNSMVPVSFFACDDAGGAEVGRERERPGVAVGGAAAGGKAPASGSSATTGGGAGCST